MLGMNSASRPPASAVEGRLRCTLGDEQTELKGSDGEEITRPFEGTGQ